MNKLKEKNKELLLYICEANKSTYIRESDNIDTGYDNFEHVKQMVNDGEIDSLDKLREVGIID